MDITIVETYEEKQKRLLCHRIDIFWVHLFNLYLASRGTGPDSFLVTPGILQCYT